MNKDFMLFKIFVKDLNPNLYVVGTSLTNFEIMEKRWFFQQDRLVMRIDRSSLNDNHIEICKYGYPHTNSIIERELKDLLVEIDVTSCFKQDEPMVRYYYGM